MTKPKPTVRQMAEVHWGYTEQLLKIAMVSGNTEETTEMLKIMILGHYLYTEAFIHGYKHGKEDK